MYDLLSREGGVVPRGVVGVVGVGVVGVVGMSISGWLCCKAKNTCEMSLKLKWRTGGGMFNNVELNRN